MNKLVKTVDKAVLTTEFLNSLNGVLQLTDRELELLATFIDLDINYIKLPEVSKNVANTENRKYITRVLGITKDNLSRYIKKFKEKGILVTSKVEDELWVNPALIPEIIKDRVQISIILRVEENEKI